MVNHVGHMADVRLVRKIYVSKFEITRRDRLGNMAG